MKTLASENMEYVKWIMHEIMETRMIMRLEKINRFDAQWSLYTYDQLQH
jgi:hypothetical protein